MTSQENNVIEQESSLNACVKYCGEVKITTMLGKKIIDSKTYTNHGTKNLFNFFANCLWGTSFSLADYKPCKVVLFAGDAQSEIKTKIVEGKEIKYFEYDGSNFTESKALSLPMIFDKTPTGVGSVGPTDILDNNTKEVIGKQVTLHFRVPYLYMVNNGSICKLGLFPKNIRYPEAIAARSDNYGSMLAYFPLLDKAQPGFAGIQIPESGDNFTVVVDWTLKIING